jgi:hypothetical protein
MRKSCLVPLAVFLLLMISSETGATDPKLREAARRALGKYGNAIVTVQITTVDPDVETQNVNTQAVTGTVLTEEGLTVISLMARLSLGSDVKIKGAKIILANGREIMARLVGRDDENDLPDAHRQSERHRARDAGKKGHCQLARRGDSYLSNVGKAEASYGRDPLPCNRGSRSKRQSGSAGPWSCFGRPRVRRDRPTYRHCHRLIVPAGHRRGSGYPVERVHRGRVEEDPREIARRSLGRG